MISLQQIWDEVEEEDGYEVIDEAKFQTIRDKIVVVWWDRTQNMKDYTIYVC